MAFSVKKTNYHCTNVDMHSQINNKDGESPAVWALSSPSCLLRAERKPRSLKVHNFATKYEFENSRRILFQGWAWGKVSWVMLVLRELRCRFSPPLRIPGSWESV